MDAAIVLLFLWGGSWRVARSFYVFHRYLKKLFTGNREEGAD